MQLVLDNKRKEMEFKGTVQDLLKELKVRREEVVIKVNGSLTPETKEIGPDDRVEIIQVVFGG